jgi:hypothetical protein
MVDLFEVEMKFLPSVADAFHMTEMRETCAGHITAGCGRNWTRHILRMNGTRIHKSACVYIPSRGPG